MAGNAVSATTNADEPGGKKMRIREREKKLQYTKQNVHIVARSLKATETITGNTAHTNVTYRTDLKRIRKMKFRNLKSIRSLPQSTIQEKH